MFESTNRLFLPRRWQQWAHWQTPPVTARQNSASEDSVRVSDSSTVSTADEQQYTFDSQMATHTTFKLFAANSDRSSLRLDLMTETSSGQIKRYVSVNIFGLFFCFVIVHLYFIVEWEQWRYRSQICLAFLAGCR